jgi:hypothetical protein
MELFGDEKIGWDTAKLIGELGGSDAVLNRHNRAITRVRICDSHKLLLTHGTDSLRPKVFHLSPPANTGGCKLIQSVLFFFIKV